MRNKQLKKRIIVVPAILFMSAINISAQVTIGALEPPHAAAILDLSQKETLAPSRGLLMPRVELKLDLTAFQLPTTGADTPEKATGMVVYNLAENKFVCPGLYVWDGSNWNRLLGEACPPYIPSVEVKATGCSTPVPPVRFMAYNLGADPTLDTPKKQMGYLVTHSFSFNNTDAYKDAHVYGGWYQWGRGRSDLAHGASIDGTYKRYGSNENVSTGPISTTPVPDQFYTADATFYDWMQTPDDTLWGNGEGLTGQDDENGGILYNDGSGDKYYQNTDWTTPDNNPCPDGFRIPTQDEWERLVNYDCRPNNAGSDSQISTNNLAGCAVARNGLTWVPVSCNCDNTTQINVGKCTPNITSWYHTATGFAIYPTNVWEATDAEYRNGTKSLHLDDAPEPLLFLPAAGCRLPRHRWRDKHCGLLRLLLE
jgi:hypothetical protein